MALLPIGIFCICDYDSHPLIITYSILVYYKAFFYINRSPARIDLEYNSLSLISSLIKYYPWSNDPPEKMAY